MTKVVDASESIDSTSTWLPRPLDQFRLPSLQWYVVRPELTHLVESCERHVRGVKTLYTVGEAKA